MNKPPAFQFYPKDFIVDDKVAVMNMEARGVYITLLCFCWNNNGLTNDQEELKEMCGNPENWEKIWKKVGKCFHENNGKLYNKRLDKERKKQEFWREKSKEGGIKSGESRRKKVKPKGGSNKTKGGSQMVEPNTNHSVSPVSSLQSPSSTSITNNIYPPEFESFWNNYPKKKEKKDAYITWKTLTKKQQEEVIIAAKHYKMETDALETQETYIKFPKTFLNKKKEKWKDYMEPPKIKKRMTAQEKEDEKIKDWARKEE